MAIEPLHPALADLWSILQRELGDGAPAALCEIAVSEAADNRPAADPVYWIWQRGWAIIAKERPESFTINPARVAPFRAWDSAWEISFLWARKNDPEAVPLLTLSGEEERLLARGREQLYELSGLRSFRRPCVNYLIDDAAQGVGACFLFPRYEDVNALSMDSFPHLRRHNGFRRSSVETRRRQDLSGAHLVTLVLHEEIHVAINLACRRRRRERELLVGAVEEAATVLAEACTYALLRGWEGVPEGLTTPAAALVDAFPDSYDAAAAVTHALDLATEVACSGSDALALQAINSRTRRRWSRRRWLAELAIS
jgi:hypothetical protein